MKTGQRNLFRGAKRKKNEGAFRDLQNTSKWTNICNIRVSEGEVGEGGWPENLKKLRLKTSLIWEKKQPDPVSPKSTK